MKKLRFLATLFVLCLSTMAWAQMKVTGTVVDMMGNPLLAPMWWKVGIKL